MIYTKKINSGNVIDIEFLENPSEMETAEPHKHEYHEIFWVIDGKGSHSIDFTEYPLSSGRLYLINPSQVHHVHAMPKQMYAISFTTEVLDLDIRSKQLLERLFVNADNLHPEITIDAEASRSLANLIDAINRELALDFPDYAYINYLFSGFLRFLTRYLTDDAKAAKHSRITALIKLIEEHSVEHKDAAFYAGKLSLSSKRLNQITQEALNKSVTQLIHENLINQAKRQLRFTNKPVKSVSAELGFKETGYFCRFFKKLTGLTPNEYGNLKS